MKSRISTLKKARWKIKKHGGIKQIIRKYGFMGLSDAVLSQGISYLRNRFYRWKDDKYEFKEVLFFPKEIGGYSRYSKILKELKNISSTGKIRILDVGSGGEGIARFLKYSDEYERYNIVLVDIGKSKVENVKLGIPVVADGCNLPFKDHTFDVVTSVDAVEHIPKEIRRKFLEELKRVTKNAVLLHFIIHDPDKGFIGRDADLKFQGWYTETFGTPELNTAEHLNAGHINLLEVQDVFPNAIVEGTQNVDVWFKYMMLGYKPIVGFFAGILYLLRWKKKDNLPPFHGCFLKWERKD
jgi:SAM-dependent methyltransferase